MADSKKNDPGHTLGNLFSLAVLSSAAYFLFIRPWHLSWGASEAELARVFPGDELVPHPQLNVMHALSIRAPASHVWPWLLQMGQGRGGLYSYESIEHAMGLSMPGRNRILPEFQKIQMGDTIPLEPGGRGLQVALLEPERVFVLCDDSRIEQSMGFAFPGPIGHVQMTWGFYLEERCNGVTRLIDRARVDWTPHRCGGLDTYLFVEPGAFLLERKMLLGLKQRAERTAARVSQSGEVPDRAAVDA